MIFNKRFVNNFRYRPLHPARKKGSTLIEVFAALFIMGGTITTMLVAQSNSLEHLHHNRLQMTARHLAQELMAEWKLNHNDLTSAQSGMVKGFEGWYWSRSAEKREIVDGLQVLEVTLALRFTFDERSLKPWSRKYQWLSRVKK